MPAEANKFSPFHLIFSIKILPENVFKKTQANKKSHKPDSRRGEGGGNEVYVIQHDKSVPLFS